MSQYQRLHAECETLLMNGQPNLVSKRIAALNTANVPREWRLPIAKVCRRAGLVAAAMKLLVPIVHSENHGGGETATNAELCEYAASLLRIGAFDEALDTLAGIDVADCPEAHLYLAHVFIAKWDHSNALACLESHLESPLDDEARMTSRLRVVECVIALSRFDEGLQLCSQIIDDVGRATHPSSWSRHRAIALELRAQAHLARNHFSQARADLVEAANELAVGGDLESFSIKKWLAVLEARQSGSTDALKAIRVEACERKAWESVREIDLQSLKIKFNQSDFEYLMFGTPIPSRRNKIAAELSVPMLADSFVLGNENGPCIDLLTCEITRSTLQRPTSQIHQVIEILLRDFYRPCRVGQLFSELFPEKTFDVFTSHHRVHQAILRTRRWLKESGLGAEIVSDSGGYSLRISGHLAFKVSLERRSVDRFSLFIEKLRDAKQDHGFGFSAREARESLGLSTSAFKRFAKWAVENGKLERYGASSATIYKVPSSEAGSRRAERDAA